MAEEFTGHLELVDDTNKRVAIHLDSKGFGSNGVIVIDTTDNKQFMRVLLTKVFDNSQKDYEVGIPKITHDEASKHKVRIIIE